MSEPKRRCFVIGPIGPVGSDIRKHADMLLNAVIKEVLERDEFGYQVFRADEVADPGMINDRVIHDIINVELAVADLTFLNANVFYELGIRHSREKPVIHFAQQGTILHSITSATELLLRILQVGTELSALGNRLLQRQKLFRVQIIRSAIRSLRQMLALECGRALIQKTES